MAMNAIGSREIRNAQSASRRATDTGEAPARAPSETLPDAEMAGRAMFESAGVKVGS